jgi:hypothetical protein
MRQKSKSTPVSSEGVVRDIHGEEMLSMVSGLTVFAFCIAALLWSA